VASIEPCAEWPNGYRSELDLCERCWVRDELDGSRYETPNIIIDGKWEVM
jgi:hypothetical protein